MRGLGLAFAAGAVLATGASASVARLRIDFSPRILEVGTRVTLSIHSTQGGPLQLTAAPPSRTAQRVGVRQVSGTLWRAAIVLDRAGQWNFHATQGNQWRR